jgi:hypothetical protein
MLVSFFSILMFNQKREKMDKKRFFVKINLSENAKKMIKEGFYDRLDLGIKKKKIGTPKKYHQGEVEVKLFSFDQKTEIGEIKKAMNQEGFQPGTTMELLVLKKDNFELQKNFPIFAIGDKEDSPLLFIQTHRYGKKLGLIKPGSPWHENSHFLGIKRK